MFGYEARRRSWRPLRAWGVRASARPKAGYADEGWLWAAGFGESRCNKIFLKPAWHATLISGFPRLDTPESALCPLTKSLADPQPSGEDSPGQGQQIKKMRQKASFCLVTP
jgi:hypothetical protein